MEGAIDQEESDGSRSEGWIKDKAKERWMLPATDQGASDGSGVGG
jgi:hypothetical protein